MALTVLLSMGCAGVAPGSPAPKPKTPPPTTVEVDWESWREQAFDRARRERRLLLVSVQASWCHWCHVMNDTTYRSARVVRQLDQSFVAIRVDADARPDLAERYANYAWPATAILTPDAQPVIALRGHRPPAIFARLLESIVADFQAGKPIAERAPEIEPDPALTEIDALRRRVRRQLDARYDEQDGGWGEGQKYPFSAPVSVSFLRARAGDEPLWQARALETLRGHAALVDPVWGGMYQYSMGDRWSEPHYEKIAAIQAGAIENFAEAYAATGDAMWLAHVRAVHRYVTDFLEAPEGGFYTSQDADLRSGERHLPGPAYYALGNADRRRMGTPRIDRHVYADLNGMLVAALCRLHAVTADASVLAQAVTAAERIERTHRRGDAYAHGHTGGPNPLLHLGDQVWMARAHLRLWEVTGERRWLERAERTLGFVLRELADDHTGALHAHTPDPRARGVFSIRRTPLELAGVAAQVLTELTRRTGDRTFQDAAERALLALADPAYLASHGRKVGQYLLALEQIAAPYVLLSVVGPPARPETGKLHRAALEFYHPARLVELGSPAHSRYPYPGRPAIYLCTDRACSLPVPEPARLATAARAFLRGNREAR